MKTIFTILPMFLVILLMVTVTFADVVEITIEYNESATTTIPTTTTTQAGVGPGWTTTTTLPPAIGPVLTYSIPPTLSLYLNETLVFHIIVSNKGDVTLHDVYVSLSGVPNASFSMIPERIAILPVNQSGDFTVSVDASGTSPGTYSLIVLIGSQEVNQTEEITFQLNPLSIQEKEKQERIEKAKPALNVIRIILISIIAASIPIAGVMLYRHLQGRCPFCGGPLETIYKGKNIVVYKCKKCKKEIYKARKKSQFKSSNVKNQ